MFKKILIPVDGSARSLAAVDCAVAVANAFDAEIRVVTVIDPLPYTAGGPDLAQGHTHYITAARRMAAETLTTACQMIHAKGRPAQSTVIEAHLVWKGILDAAHTHEADLVVMGSHGSHGLQFWILGGVTQQVLQHATVPVIVVPDSERTLSPPFRSRDSWLIARAKNVGTAESHRRR